MVDTKAKKTRHHSRVKSPKGLFVAWETGSRRAVSRLETPSLGGVFIHTTEPPPVGSMINMLLDMQNGDVRALAVVRRLERGWALNLFPCLPKIGLASAINFSNC